MAGAGIRFVRGDVRPLHEAMPHEAAGKHVWIAGGGDLAGQFHDAELLDEVIVTATSVPLGAGALVLPRRITTPPLTLRSARAYGMADAELVYTAPKPAAGGEMRR